MTITYYANPIKAAADAFAAGELGVIITPKQGNRMPEGTQRWTADNGCFGKGYPGDVAWIKWLAELPYDRTRCEFATAPDVVGDAAATLERSRPWLPQIRALGYKAAFVAQDGLTVETCPWDEFDVLFIGGSTEFKLGAMTRELTAEARRRGMPVHMGRVNSYKRLAYAEAIGCTSADGTFLTFAPKENLERVRGWYRQLAAAPASLFDTAAA